MRHRFASSVLFLVPLLVVLPGVSRVCAGEVSPEVWIGAGVSYPDYDTAAEACCRGGIGAVFAEHFTLGISGQADRDHFHYFADAGVILPQIGLLVPYGRYQFGRRDDRDDNAWGWCAGLRLVGDGISLFVEAHEILEPEFDKGISLGIWF